MHTDLFVSRKGYLRTRMFATHCGKDCNKKKARPAPRKEARLALYNRHGRSHAMEIRWILIPDAFLAPHILLVGELLFSGFMIEFH